MKANRGYLMKDRQGESMIIDADRWVWTGVGLRFERRGKHVAYFNAGDWQHVQELTPSNLLRYLFGSTRWWFGFFVGLVIGVVAAWV